MIDRSLRRNMSSVLKMKKSGFRTLFLPPFRGSLLVRIPYHQENEQAMPARFVGLRVQKRCTPQIL